MKKLLLLPLVFIFFLSNALSQPVDPNPLLFQTWYLYQVDVDLGDPVFYNGPNPPQITINEDLTYTGIEGCMIISGNFIHEEGVYTEFILQPQNYTQDITNCPPGPVGYALYDLLDPIDLHCDIFQDNGIDYFQYESYPGFISYFRNILILSAPENNITKLTVYPNPANEKLIIESWGNDLEAISISDVNGRNVISIFDVDSNEINVSTLKAGLYFIKIVSSKGNITRKFIKN